MQPTYVVTKRGPKGEPQDIQCAAHPDCKWRAGLKGPKRDDDPIFMALFAQHLRDAAPSRQIMGHQRRARQ